MRFRQLKHRKDCRPLVDLLLNIPVEFRGMTAIEVGSFYGESAVIFSLFFKPVYCVDPFYDSRSAKLTGRHIHAVFDKQTEGRDIISVVADSDAGVSQTPDKVAFVYIDANHTREAVLNDIRNYWDKIIDGGYIAGHDYGCTGAVQDAGNNIGKQNGVKPAVDSLLGIPDDVFPDSSWLIKKTGTRRLLW
jgi:cephalosporin hydroxylase